MEFLPILAFRAKTQCKQYNFKSYEECFHYFNKKCYENEFITVIEYSEETRKEVFRHSFINYRKASIHEALMISQIDFDNEFDDIPF